MSVTVVSYFYKIKKKKFDNKVYINWISNYLKVLKKSIIFTDDETKQFLESYFPSISDHHILFIYPISEFYTTKNYNWENDYYMDYEQINHSIDLYKLWNEKIFFLCKAIELNYFKTEYFLLLDIGCFRYESNINEIILSNFPSSYNFIKNKVTMGKMTEYPTEILKNINEIDNRFNYNTNIGNSHGTYIGGLFGGDKFALTQFRKKYISLLNEFDNKKIFKGKDQSIYNFLYLQNKNLIHILDSICINKNYDRWFCFHYFFSDYFKFFISILIPLYNGIEFLENCISSISTQTYQHFEIIIGINGWEENNGIFQQVYDISQKFPNCNIIIKNIGILNSKNNKSAALNRMMNHISKETTHIAVLDVDDYWEETKLEKQLSYMKEYDVIGTFFSYTGDLDIKIENLPYGDISDFDFKKVNPICNSSSIIKKEYALWNENCIVEDYYLWFDLRRRNKKFFIVNEYLTIHRVHGNSFFNRKKSKEQQEDIKKFILDENI